jgi:hypothetical protein
VDADELALFTGIPEAQRLAMLREQLWLLVAVHQDVQLHAQILRTQVTGNPGYDWQSVAEHGYAERVTELGDSLERAGRDLEAAVDAVRQELARRNTAEGG